jgi:two-component system, NarL family, response regulator NreC
MVSIVLADDFELVRSGIRILLEQHSTFSVIGEANNEVQALELVETVRPDVLIIGLTVSNISGLEVIKQVQPTQTRVVMLSLYTDEDYVVQVLLHGAHGYVLKSSPLSELIQAITTVHNGHYYLSPSLPNSDLDTYLEKVQSAACTPLGNLTQRERQVLQLVVEGYTSSRIARRLSISPRTVEVHRANAMRKLNVHSTTELIHYAVRNGILYLKELPHLPHGFLPQQ